MITEDVSTQYSVPTTPERSTPHSRPIEQSTCRFWDGHTDRQSYRLVTCGHCYKYLFPENTELVPYGTYLVSINGTVFPHGTFVKPDISNATLTKRICETLESQASCNQWLECCEAAQFCCSEQLNDASAVVVDAESRDCPSTWDGFACWGRVKAGTSAKRSCPSYVPHAIPTGSYILMVVKGGGGLYLVKLTTLTIEYSIVTNTNIILQFNTNTLLFRINIGNALESNTRKIHNKQIGKYKIKCDIL